MYVIISAASFTFGCIYFVFWGVFYNLGWSLLSTFQKEKIDFFTTRII